jgi:hypothetical protein
MKHHFTILLFVALLSATVSDGQTSLLIGRSNTHFDLSTGEATIGDSSILSYNALLQHSQYLNFRINALGYWYVSSRLTDYTYDANGNQLGFLIQSGNDTIGWTNSLRYTYTYDGNNNELSSLVEKWINTGWVTNTETIRVYDVNGNLLSSTGLFGRNLYSYNAEGLLEIKIYQEMSNGNWVNRNQYEYTYLPNDPKYASETTYDWQINTWQKNSRSIDTYDTNGHLIQNLTEIWDGVSWVSLNRTINAYDAAGYQTDNLLQQWNGATWDDLYLYTQSYDASHNLIYWLSQTNFGAGWEPSLRQFNGFDAKSNFTHGRLEVWDGLAWTMESYGHLNYLELVSTKNPVQASLEFYPNPASTSVTLRGTGFSRAMIFDQAGRLVYNQSLQGQSEETLKLGNLPAGNYFLQAIGLDGKVGAKPLQIRH